MLLRTLRDVWLLLTDDIPDCGLRKNDAVLIDQREGWQDDGYYVVRTPRSPPGRTASVYLVKVLTSDGKIRKNISINGLHVDTDNPQENIFIHKVLNRYRYSAVD